MNKLLLSILLSIFILMQMSCSNNSTDSTKIDKIDSTRKITFIELGSDNCIPCQNMQPILDSIQKKYGNQILVKFIDVIKNPNDAEPYKISVMPTQVFLDSLNKEVYRHEGFLPEDSIHVFLKSQGLVLLY
jgi:thioredoxin 1